MIILDDTCLAQIKGGGRGSATSESALILISRPRPCVTGQMLMTTQRLKSRSELSLCICFISWSFSPCHFDRFVSISRF